MNLIRSGRFWGAGGEWVLGCKMLMGRSLFLFLISNWPRRAYVHGRLRVGHVRSRRVMGQSMDIEVGKGERLSVYQFGGGSIKKMVLPPPGWGSQLIAS